MGTFTNQVQGLVSEQKQARIEREQKQQEKLQKTITENKLYKYFMEILEDTPQNNIKNVFFELLQQKIDIIEYITKNKNLQFYLLQNYTKILNNASKPYLLLQKEAERQEKENTKNILQKQKKQEKKQKEFIKNPSTFDVIKSILKCVLLILFLPIAFIGLIFYYLIKDNGKRKRRK